MKTMRGSLLENLPDALAGVKTRPLFVMRLSSRIASFFETAAPQYDWLNRLIAVGIGHRTAEGPIYSLFELL
jgi:hypothetical protein